MPTLHELQTQVKQAQFRKAILLHVVEYLDAEFQASMGGDPKRVLLTDEKVRVPTESIDEVIDAINTWVKNIDEYAQKLLEAEITIQYKKGEEPTPPADEKKQEEPAPAPSQETAS